MRWIVKHLVLLALQYSAEFTVSDRALFTAKLLDKMRALPVRDILTTDEQGTLLVNGRSLDPESVIRLRESARVLKESRARKLIKGHIRFLAIKEGVHKASNDEQVLFSKAALWIDEQEDYLLNLLAPEEPEEGNLTP